MDDDLRKGIKEKVFCFATDGAEVMVQAVQQLKPKPMGHLPNLRYQFRDAAHSTNCMARNAEKHANPDTDVKELLVTAQDSFCNHIRWQTNCREDWNTMDGSDNYALMMDLADAKHRWHTKTKQMSALCLKSLRCSR